MSNTKNLQQRLDELELEVNRLTKVNTVLMNRVERSLDSTGNSYSLFESNILLQHTVDDRTRELKTEIERRQQIETELRKSRQKLLLHVQQTPLGVVEFDMDFHILEWNSAAGRIFGHTREEAIGRDTLDLIVPESCQSRVRRVWDALISKPEGVRSTNENVRKDGTILTCDWYNTPLVDENGEVVGVAALVQDVTERTNNDREKKDRLERIQRQRTAIGRMATDEVVTGGSFEQAARLILEIVAEALRTERVSFWTLDEQHTRLQCVDLYEASKHRHSAGTTLDSSDFPRYFEAVSRERVLACDDARTDPRTSEFTEAYLAPQGITAMLDIAFRVSGNLAGVVCNEHTGTPRTWQSDEIAFADEISGYLSQVHLNAERRRSEEQKRQLQDQLERAQRMESLGLLAGGVAHDLNNMLGPVVGYSELILRRMDPSDRLAQQVQKIARSAQDAVDVIQDLLSLARRGRYDMVPTNLNQVVTDYLDSPAFINLTQGGPDIQVSVELDESIGQLMGSSAHLSKVVMNLVVNAFDAMPDGGELTISTSSRQLEQLPNGHPLGGASGEYLMLSIADTGKGIPTEDLAKIFEPYYSRKKMVGSSGSGLGLSVVYGIVKDHKAFYDILTSPDTGTEFQFFFPVTDIKSDRTEPEMSEPGGTGSVLVVDDSAGQRDVATALLSSIGYDVRTAASGEEAVEYLKHNAVDLVLLDMIMEPGIDGLDTYREIVKLHPGQKAVIASGYSTTDRVEEMQKLGAGQYIRKPYTLKSLGKAVREELSGTPLPTV